MPRKAKDTTNVDKENIIKEEVISKKSTTKTTTKKGSTKTNEKTISSKVPKTQKSIVKKSIVESTVTHIKKKTTIKPTPESTTSTKKNTTTKSGTNTKKKSTTKSTLKSSVTKKSSSKTSKKVEIIEYYDLPYKYNQTVVKIIAQTPTTLFVYWDVSDEDKKAYIKQYGEYFYNNTKPVLIIYNITKNYSFEVDINDYANSWYLKINDSKCDYKIELGRRGINQYVNIPNNYLHISSSNELEVPNDHILFENMSEKVYFKNVKTGQITTKDISSISFLRKIGTLYNIKEFYKLLYTNKNFTFEEFNLKNPSSGNPTSTFK